MERNFCFAVHGTEPALENCYSAGPEIARLFNHPKTQCELLLLLLLLLLLTVIVVEVVVVVVVVILVVVVAAATSIIIFLSLFYCKFLVLLVLKIVSFCKVVIRTLLV
jgi:hypothetical protein